MSHLTDLKLDLSSLWVSLTTRLLAWCGSHCYSTPTEVRAGGDGCRHDVVPNTFVMMPSSDRGAPLSFVIPTVLQPTASNRGNLTKARCFRR